MNKIKTPRLLILVLIVLTVIIGIVTIGIVIFLQNSTSTATQSASASGPDLRSSTCSPYVKSPITECSQRGDSDHQNFIVDYKSATTKPTLSLATMALTIVDKDTNQPIQGGYSVKGAHDYRVGQCIDRSGQQTWCYGNACNLSGDLNNSSGPLPLGNATAGLDCLNSDFKVTFDTTNLETNQLTREYDVNSISNCSVKTKSGVDGAKISGTGTNITANLCTDIHNQPNVDVVCQASKKQATTVTPSITTTPVATPSPSVGPTNTPTPVVTPSPSVGPTLTPTPVITPSPSAVVILTPTPTTPIKISPTPVLTVTPTATSIPVIVTPVPTPAPPLPSTGITDDLVKLTLIGMGFIGASLVLYKIKFFNLIQNIFGSDSSNFENKVKKKLKNKK